MSVTLNDNPLNAPGGIGQFATGTFVAIAPIETIAFSGNTGSPTINAFQLRAVPEPSTLILAALGGLALLAWRRR